MLEMTTFGYEGGNVRDHYDNIIPDPSKFIKVINGDSYLKIENLKIGLLPNDNLPPVFYIQALLNDSFIGEKILATNSDQVFEMIKNPINFQLHKEINLNLSLNVTNISPNFLYQITLSK